MADVQTCVRKLRTPGFRRKQVVRNRAGMLALQKSFAMRKATRLALTPAVTDRAIALMGAFALGHGLQVADALIAAPKRAFASARGRLGPIQPETAGSG